MTTPIVDAPTSSVRQSSTPCRAPTSRQPLGSSPPATLPAHALCLAALAVGAVHLPVVGAGFASPSLPVTTTAVNLSVITIMVRQLHCRAHCTSSQSTASLRDPTACRARCVASLGLPPSATSPARTPSASLRSSSASPLRVCAARCGLRRHRLPHFAILYCPFHCQRLCTSLRQRAPHDCLQLPLHFPHSVAVAAPASVPRPRRFPLAHTRSLSFWTACRGFGFHTRRALGAVVATVRLTALRTLWTPPLRSAMMESCKRFVSSYLAEIQDENVL